MPNPKRRRIDPPAPAGDPAFALELDTGSTTLQRRKLPLGPAQIDSNTASPALSTRSRRGTAAAAPRSCSPNVQTIVHDSPSFPLKSTTTIPTRSSARRTPARASKATTPLVHPAAIAWEPQDGVGKPSLAPSPPAIASAAPPLIIRFAPHTVQQVAVPSAPVPQVVASTAPVKIVQRSPPAAPRTVAEALPPIAPVDDIQMILDSDDETATNPARRNPASSPSVPPVPLRSPLQRPSVQPSPVARTLLSLTTPLPPAPAPAPAPPPVSVVPTRIVTAAQTIVDSDDEDEEDEEIIDLTEMQDVSMTFVRAPPPPLPPPPHPVLPPAPIIRPSLPSPPRALPANPGGVALGIKPEPGIKGELFSDDEDGNRCALDKDLEGLLANMPGRRDLEDHEVARLVEIVADSDVVAPITRQIRLERSWRNMVGERSDKGKEKAKDGAGEVQKMKPTKRSPPGKNYPERADIRVIGLRCDLMEHQLVGLHWMTSQEDKELRGGILADDMGLGKTVQTIALILHNPHPTFDSTLIVCPLSLIGQWQREIGKHAGSGKLRVATYHGKNKLSPAELATYNVVITTYATLASEAPMSPVKPGDVMDHEAWEALPAAAAKRVPAGALFRVTWWRVVLDEAQYVKGKDTRASKAAAALDAMNRWCLSGTPIQNNLDELWSLFRFLRVPVFSSHQTFRKAILNVSTRKAIARLQQILKGVLLRRTKTQKDAEGNLILTLPPKTVFEEAVHFSEDERAFYEALERRARLQFNKYVKEGVVMKHYSNILVLLLRLRQAADHPFLVLRDAMRNLNNGSNDDRQHALDQENNNQLLQVMLGLPANERGQDQRQVASRAGGRTLLGNRPRVANEDNMTPELLAEVQKARRIMSPATFARLCKAGEEKSLQKGDGEGAFDGECPVCTDVLSNGVVTSCGHPFCKECIEQVFTSDAINFHPEEEEDPRARPPNMYVSTAAFIPEVDPLDLLNEEEDFLTFEQLAQLAARDLARKKREAEGAEGNAKETMKGKTLAEQARINEEELKAQQAKDNEAITNMVIRSGDSEWVSSTKIDRLLEILKQIQEEDPGSKTVVFSQFTSFLDQVEKGLERENISWHRYDGAMKAQERENSLNDLEHDETTFVLLVSLRCGGVGLNLTSASRVIMLDVWWNPALEDQAVDRVHRIGQMKEVKVFRLTVANSVETRILDLQRSKKALSQGVLGEGAEGQMARLTEGDLARLFG
ncbi:hypothetical protein HDU93_006836 [Gonapodya sp. JEL0774]|nr:hypothetical protein HDU93_006836 [Gonapodya sp. JEL0774]